MSLGAGVEAGREAVWWPCLFADRAKWSDACRATRKRIGKGTACGSSAARGLCPGKPGDDDDDDD